MGQHRRPKRTGAPGEHPAVSLLLPTGAAILVTAVMFTSSGLADTASNRPRQKTVATAAASPPAKSEASRSAARRPTLELRWSRGQSWVRVTDGKGTVLANDIYPKGTVKKFTGSTLHVEIGNAGAVTMVDKGGKPQVAGPAGKLVKATVTGP